MGVPVEELQGLMKVHLGFRESRKDSLLSWPWQMREAAGWGRKGKVPAGGPSRKKCKANGSRWVMGGPLWVKISSLCGFPSAVCIPGGPCRRLLHLRQPPQNCAVPPGLGRHVGV